MRINMLLSHGARKDTVQKVVEECLRTRGIKLLNVQTTKLDTGARFMLFTTSTHSRTDVELAVNDMIVPLRDKVIETRVF